MLLQFELFSSERPLSNIFETIKRRTLLKAAKVEIIFFSSVTRLKISFE